MRKFVKVVLLFVAFSFLLHVPVFAESIPEGPWNYVNGVWVKIDLPDNSSPWEWVPGHRNKSNWIAGHWKQVEPISGEAAEWVPAHSGADGKWVHGHWKKVEVVGGKTWVSGHWRNGRWVSGHWTAVEVKETKSRVWVPRHRDASGRWVHGYWEVR